MGRKLFKKCGLFYCEKYFSECDEYKDTIARISKSWTTFLQDDSTNCGTKTFECGSVGTSGLIVGGLPAKVGEFPHMAGKFKV